jgi:hypothetical protein
MFVYDGFIDGGTSPDPSAGEYNTGDYYDDVLGSEKVHDGVGWVYGVGQGPTVLGFSDATNPWTGVAKTSMESPSAFGSTGYFRTEDGGLTYQGLVTAAGQVWGFRDTDVRRKFVYRSAITSDVSETQWISMLINFNSTFDDGTNWASFDLGWVGDASAFNNQDHGVSVLAVGVESDSRKPFFLTTNGAQGIEENQVGASPLAADATHLLLLKIASEEGSSLYDEITMWVDPDLSAGEAGLTGGLVGRGIIRDDASGDLQSFSGLRLACKTGGGGGVAFDEFRMGTTFEDVTIPEPSLVTLAVSGLLGLLCYAWRKRK